MSKLLVNGKREVIVGSNGKAYAVTNLDAERGIGSPIVLDAAAGSVLKLMRYGKVEQEGTPTPSAPQDIVCNNGVIAFRHQSGLPIGYTLLDRVYNSTGTKIDTGLYDDVDDVEYEIRCQVRTGSWYIFQFRTGSTYGGVAGSATGNTITCLVRDGVTLTSNLTREANNIYYVKFTHKNGVATLYVKNETTGEEDTQTETYTDYTPTSETPIFLWGNSVNNVGQNNYIYYAKLRKNDEIIMDYVPCQYNGENGFYDFVSDTFKGATIGTINAGEPVDDPLVRYTDGTPEVITLGEQTASVENLFAVGDYKDEQDVISGEVTRRCGVCVYDGTQDIGNIRETFFLNQLQVNHQVRASSNADFVIDGTYTFELGGKGKGQRQIADTPYSFVVKDDIEEGMFNILPLWHFGLMY